MNRTTIRFAHFIARHNYNSRLARYRRGSNIVVDYVPSAEYRHETVNRDDGRQFAIPLLDAQDLERQRVFDDLKKRAGWS